MRPLLMTYGALLASLMGAGLARQQPGPMAPATPLTVSAAANSETIPRYDVLELSFRHEGDYKDPFLDVTVEVALRSPGGQTFRVGGFHCGSSAGPTIIVHQVPASGGHGPGRRAEYRFDKHDLWKARFAPSELGHWTYSYVFADRRGGRATGQGSFDCVAGRSPGRGYVRQSSVNPFRWSMDDGTPYFPIGIQECLGDSSATGSFLPSMSLEGPFRLDRAGRPTLPPGPLFQAGPAMNPVNADLYFRTYARAGFNLFRYSQCNCTPNLYTDLDHYLAQEAAMTDELLRHVRKYGFRVFYGIFGYQPVFSEHPENAEGMAKLKRFIKYSVDRWGAYVDCWEFLNEQKADARWYAELVPYLRSIDPYHHPITTSWERPELPGIDISAPHWYPGVHNELGADEETAANAGQWKRAGKPVVVGEHGNSASPEDLRVPGVGGVWDPGSALRMRIRNWTALFTEISFIFWNTSYARDGHSMNMWLGPQERQYVHGMQDFAGRLYGDVRMTSPEVSDRHAVRAYGLRSGRQAAVYLHHAASHSSPVGGLTLSLDVPRAADGYWYSPENAAIVKRVKLPAGRQIIDVPQFTVDLALLVTDSGAPDIDHDGKPNDVDADDDNDGVPDVRDAFPIDPDESADRDGDLIGDNRDADKDGDGVADDDNHNGIPDWQELDLDGDGVPASGAAPWDAFPRDKREWRDTDGDGIGDNADRDKDGDGWTDAEERRGKTDPLNRLSFPTSAARRGDGPIAHPRSRQSGAAVPWRTTPERAAKGAARASRIRQAA